MSTSIYNDSGATINVYQRASNGTWSAFSPATVADGASILVSSGITSIGLSIGSAGTLTDDTQFNEGLWKDGVHAGSPGNHQSASSSGNCGSSCHSTLAAYASFNCHHGDIQPTAANFKKSIHNITKTYIFDYNDTARFEWDALKSTASQVCPDQMPLRISIGGAPAIRRQGTTNGSFFRITKGKTTQ
jgi:hypothetical protein